MQVKKFYVYDKSLHLLYSVAFFENRSFSESFSEGGLHPFFLLPALSTEALSLTLQSFSDGTAKVDRRSENMGSK
jgi:hypothetical protein